MLHAPQLRGGDEARVHLPPASTPPCVPPYKQEPDQCRHSNECESANHLCCLVGCARRCVHGVPIHKHY
ncbi:hypothetical protein MTO96_008886 [Rhipicephalus appendiculatus]